MKKVLFASLFLILVMGLQACTKKKGDLTVNVVDGLNNPLGAGHTVYLYSNQSDFDNGIYTETGTTNNFSQVYFVKLTPGLYFVDCQYENLLGFTNTASGSGSVTGGQTTTITIK